MDKIERRHRICPWWMGYFLASPLRKIRQNPFKILSPFVKEGMTVADIGCAMGFFSIPMGRIIGEKGIVYCFDVQERMLKTLEKRITRSGMKDRFVLRLCKDESLGGSDINGKADFVLCYAVVHEVPNALSFFKEISDILAVDGKFLFAEPKKRISEKEFLEELAAAKNAGFKIIGEPEIFGSRSALLGK